MEMSLIPEANYPVLDVENAKRLRFRIGKWFMIFFAFSFLVPAFIYMTVKFFPVGKNASLPHNLSRSVFWKDKLWFVSSDDKQPAGHVLKNIDIPWFSCSVSIADIPCEYGGRLLTGNNELWIPSSKRIGVFRDGHFSEYPQKTVQQADKEKNRLVTRSEPFIYGGLPARIEGEKGEWNLVILNDGEWVHSKTLILPEFKSSVITQGLLSGKLFPSLPWLDRERHYQPNLSELEIRCHLFKDSLHIFLDTPDRSFDGIYYTIIPLTSDPENQIAKTWRRLDFYNFDFFPFHMGSTIYLGGNGWFFGQVNFFSLDNGEWKKSFSYKMPKYSTSLLTIFSEQNQNHAWLIMNKNGEDLIEVKLDASGKEISRFKKRLVSGWKEKESFMENFGYFFSCFSAICAIIALIMISRFQKKMGKVLFHDMKGHSFQTATIIRRSIALFIDLIIFIAFSSIPLAIGLILEYEFKDSLTRFITFSPYFWSEISLNLYLIVSLVIAIFIFVLFSIMEGRYSKSPGKIMLGLRLVDELGQPCGFKRIFLRNMLKIGLFIAMPFPAVLLIGGIFIIQLNALAAALSEKGQHIGDLVVSSLVVRKVKMPKP